MKKSKIAVAAFAVIIATASLVKAERFDIDFDRGAFRTVDFMEAGKTSDVSKADNTASITPIPAPALDTVSTGVYKLAAPSLQRLRKETLNIPGLSKEFLQQINEEKTIVLYNEGNVFLTTLVGNTQYIILESNDRKLLEFLAKQQKEVLQAGLQNKGKVKVCVTVIKTLWKWIKEAWVAYEISKEVCSWQDDGATPSTGNPAGSGSTYHNGQGGDSNYDVNKYLK